MARHRFGIHMGAILIAALALGGVTGCDGDETPAESGGTQEPEPPRIVLVREIGEADEGSFNALAEDGLSQAAAEFDIETEVITSDDARDYAGNIAHAAGGSDLVFTVGEWMMAPTAKVAAEESGSIFAGIDQPYRTPGANSIGLLFKEHEAAYLAGVVAGQCTLDEELDSRINSRNVIGFVGGTRIPLVERYQAGFVAGARSVNPTVTILAEYVGSFDDAKKGRALTNDLIDRGADIVFVAAGESGLGALKAVKDGPALMIGVETDQCITLPGADDVVLTSAIKRVDVVVFEVIRRFIEGSLEPGRNIELGLADKGVGIAPFHGFEETMSSATVRALETARSDIASGTVVVPETMAELE